ncbi:hypothetical protein [Ferribacterium limneticum]|uniref:hypothetical protein n=1 Tax=Ferribacterium limneticum TaxID=76259 RepID=UPI001CF86F3E|nr:hypothetical protein [Ferribacterium limneticum]UCV26811.1 hypothetical protein KI617_10860 [Ferribacterium limneticum]UCV30728.1 hypothetical protein KI608_10860 [Ferribacterium limneticum]
MGLILDRAAVDVPYSVKAAVADFDELRVGGQRVTKIYAESYAGVTSGQVLTNTVNLLNGRQTIVEVHVLLPHRTDYTWQASRCQAQLKVNGVVHGTIGVSRDIRNEYQTATFIMQFVAPADGAYVLDVVLSMSSVVVANGSSTYTNRSSALPVNVTVTIWP